MGQVEGTAHVWGLSLLGSPEMSPRTRSGEGGELLKVMQESLEEVR